MSRGTAEKVHRALVDPRAVASWMVPPGMRSEVHAFDAREGGVFPVSLTDETPLGSGKTTARTDTFHGRFVELVPGQRVVQLVEFETCRRRTTRWAGVFPSASSRGSWSS